MIVPMYKYYFLTYHEDYEHFLREIRQLGVVHIVKREVENTPEIKEKYQLINKLEKTIESLENRKIQQSGFVNAESDGIQVMDRVYMKLNELEILSLEQEKTAKELKKAEPWGNFSPEILQLLKENAIHIRFFSGTKKRYYEFKEKSLLTEIISEIGNQVYFIVIQTGNQNTSPDPDEIKPPEFSLSVYHLKYDAVTEEISEINKQLDKIAATEIPSLEKTRIELLESLNFETVKMNTRIEADDKLCILEGWVPVSKKAPVDKALRNTDALCISRRSTPDDSIPVLLKNNRFSKLFEPIGSMFSLPDYNELDLTIFFAPFFMLFFGFCLGDAGYGLLFVIGAGIYKLKAGKNLKPYLSLIQFLGLATVIFGTISGTFFGINLIEADFVWLNKIKFWFLDSNKMFYLALILGAIQIIFGMCIKAANQTRQFGFKYALSTLGWIEIFLGCALYFLLTKQEIISENKTLLTIIVATGGFFILFFSDPKLNIFSRIGKGIWDIYSTVTGIFGDLLSYIRLFALGMSSAILGFVINDIALQILGASKILGPVFFLVFLLLGHTLNILISSLGSFVHPMRLTFVEFYKNAGFKGGGEEYKPFVQ